ncbi:MAG TPA: hypothetical protein PKY82_03255 [Pyrinomonadaceae bacterium]|nr:hypothetical protein [Pyrinomonadaceae bacterium]
MEKSKTIFILLAFITIIASCSNQESKHKIYGKWISVDSPKATLNFLDDNFVSAEIFAPNDVVYKKRHRFIIIDEKTAEVIENTQPEYKCRIRVTLQTEDKLRFECQCQKSPDGRSIVDLPELCTYKEFKKVE